jgi:hypothetical protein
MINSINESINLINLVLITIPSISFSRFGLQNLKVIFNDKICTVPTGDLSVESMIRT